MTVTAKTLISSKFAANTDTVEYTAPANTRTIVDKFTATNTDSGSVTISVNIIEVGGSVGSSNLVVKTKSVAAGATEDLSVLQNQILEAGEKISVIASVASKMVIRASGREVE